MNFDGSFDGSIQNETFEASINVIAKLLDINPTNLEQSLLRRCISTKMNSDIIAYVYLEIFNFHWKETFVVFQNVYILIIINLILILIL